jgi:hypothetical protein
MPHRIIRALLACIVCICATEASRADVVLEWNTIMLDTLVGQSSVNETRVAAITQLAVFEAVNAVTRDYRPYLGTIKAKRGASAEAAAVAAAHAILRNYVPAQAPQLDAARARSLAAIPDGTAKNDGIAVGAAAAAAMIAVRANDGSEPAQFYMPASSEPGQWQLTPSCPPQGGVAANWGNVQPFGLRSVRPFRLGPPPALDSESYAVAYNEVKKVGGVDSTARPQDRADVAQFYAAVLTIRTWNPVATQVAAQYGGSLAHSARALALLNSALSDALVAVFDTKYRMPFWRPETAIRAGDTDGNRATRGDASFAPFVQTPCHPSYASAHASAAYAAQAVLEQIYGSRGHRIALSSPLVPGVTLHYSSFRQMTVDIDDARVYGGIHFPFDQEAGARQGQRIGTYVYEHNLCPGAAPHASRGHEHDCGPRY